jgi:hypothetical protein
MANSHLQLQDQVRVGTVLETYDCGYILVEEILPEGVISRTPINPRYLWTWSDLSRLQCIIYRQPDANENVAESAARWSAQVTESGGVVEDCNTGQDGLVDVAVAGELRRIVPATWDKIRLQARVVDDSRPFDLNVTGGDDYHNEIEATESLRQIVAKHHEFTTQCQAAGWKRMNFTTWRAEAGEWRYDVQLGY